MSKTPITDGYEWASWPGMTMPAECCRELEMSRDQWRRMCTMLAGQLQQWVEAFDGESNDFELGQDIEAIRQYLAMFEREKGKFPPPPSPPPTPAQTSLTPTMRHGVGDLLRKETR